MSTHAVTLAYGYGTRTGVVMEPGTVTTTVGTRQAQRYVASQRAYASGLADTVSDVTDPDSGIRTITANHWINGFENIRVLTIVSVA